MVLLWILKVLGGFRVEGHDSRDDDHCQCICDEDEDTVLSTQASQASGST